MNMEYGKFTRELGLKLYKKYLNSSYAVYYDPHIKKRIDEPNACEPTPFFDECSEATTLSISDIVIVNKNNNLVELIVEIEESGSVPKKMIGDIGNIILSEKMRINRKNYNYGNVKFIFGVNGNIKGDSEKKIENIKQKLLQINKKTGNKNIEILPIFKDNLDSLVMKIEEQIYEMFPL